MTFGDAFAFTMLVLLTASSLWAALVASVLLFPERSHRAAEMLRTRRLRSLILGAVTAVGGIGLGIALMNAPAAVVKILGILLLGLVAFTAVLGCSGLVEIAGARVAQDTDNAPLPARGKAAALLLLAGLLPGVGWFLFFPLQLFAGVGAGLAVVFSRKSQSTPTIEDQ